MNQNNKWAFITGASRGLGKLIALYMADKGYNLILHSRKIANSDEIANELSKFPIQIKRVAAELSNLDDVDQMLKTIDSFDLKVDIVFNNAGYQIAYRNDYIDTPDSDFSISFAVNTIAPMKICYHFLPKMMDNNYGRIINTTSGIINDPHQAGYSASKYALNRVIQDLATTVSDYDISLTLVDPGWCRTDLGGQQATNSPSSALPGVILGAFIASDYNGEYVSAQDYAGLTLSNALNKFEQMIKS